jgi:chromosome segregation ATPase
MPLEELMLARFDTAKEQLGELLREAQKQTDPPEYLLGYWRQQATDLLSVIYESLPKTRDYVLKHLLEADRATFLNILEDARRIEPPLRIAPTESADKAYFATLVDRTIARSWFFRGATFVVVVMIGVSVAMLGLEIHGISELSQDVAREIENARTELKTTQSDMRAQVEEARDIKTRIDAGTAELQTTLLGIEGDVAALIDRFKAAKATVETQQQELNEVRARWKIERAAWEKEIPTLTNYFTTQKERFEQDAGAVLASLKPLLDQGRGNVGRVETLRQQAETIRGTLNAQLTEAEGNVGIAARAAEAAESSRNRIDDVKEGFEAKVAAATRAAESATASAAGLVQRLDATRGELETALADSDNKRARLNEVLASWETSHREWIDKLKENEAAVAEASSAAIEEIASLTKDPEATLDRRRSVAESVVDDIERHERAAADLLQSMKSRDDALRTRESETRATLDQVNETLSGLRRELAFFGALTEKIEGRRSEAEAELDALLAERPPLTIASVWQAARSSFAATTSLVVSGIAALLAVLALWLSARRRDGAKHGSKNDQAPLSGPA